MSKTQSEKKTPFFARFIERKALETDTAVTAGANGGGTTLPPQTLKYPSDGDDTYGTFKGGTEYDERW